ncbi:MAG: hypothetical protein ABSC94_24170 [Polyangiaceae bacterium]|jgi:hypothetical protein
MGAAVVAVLAGAASTGLLVPDAAAQIARRPEDEYDNDAQLLVAGPADPGNVLAGHRSHSSHASHQSHYSGSGGGGSGGSYVTPAPAPPPPPQPARVSIVAYPGGRIFLDDRLVGRDAAGPLTVGAGSHTIRVENRFIGTESREVELQEGQTGIIEIAW